MDMATALAGLGATEAALDAETAERLDRDGYAPLPAVLDAAQLTAIRVRLAELLAAEGDQAGIEVHQEAGADRLADLVNKGAMFDPCFTDPRHGGTENRSDRPRRALHSYFTRRANGQQLDQKKYVRPGTLARLSPAARFILDV
jgi:ectoine hydroxylase-related dioxygenase (phytanoyl-CoA dioxygenase family)